MSFAPTRDEREWVDRQACKASEMGGLEEYICRCTTEFDKQSITGITVYIYTYDSLAVKTMSLPWPAFTGMIVRGAAPPIYG